MAERDKDSLKIKDAQKRLLRSFARVPGDFALAGGTALELYYLHHRFSADLDFFSPKYNRREIEEILRQFAKDTGAKAKFEAEFIARNMARVRFYSVSLKGLARPIKVDFVQDTLFDKPRIKRFAAVPVYSIEHIYLQKITAIIGTRELEDDTGRPFMQGRDEARDAFDLYMLSKKIRPLHQFIKGLPRQMQRGMVHWYRTFSRHELILGLLDLDIYVKEFNSRKMIVYLEREIQGFVKELAEE